VLAREPAPIPVAHQLVEAFQAWVEWSASEGVARLPDPAVTEHPETT